MKRSKILRGNVERWRMTATGLKIYLFCWGMGADASLCYQLDSKGSLGTCGGGGKYLSCPG